MSNGRVSAVGMLARREIRSRWRGAVMLVLLVGIVGAVVLSTLAGARRTDTALERFDAASRSADVSLFPAIGYTPTSVEMNALRRLPDVVAATELRSFAVVANDAPATLVILAKRDRDAGRVVDRDRLIAGRRPNPNAVDEVAVSESLAAQLHQGVGGTIHGSSYSPPQLLAAAQTGALPESPNGPPLSWRIVGIVRRPLDLGNLAAQGGVMVLTRAFDHAYADRIGIFGAVIRVRTIHGANDVASVTKRAQQIFSASGPVSTQGVQTESVGAQNAIDVLTLALRILAAVVGLAGLVTIAIVLTREVTLANVDHDTLRLLGVTRLQRLLINGPRALLIA